MPPTKSRYTERRDAPDEKYLLALQSELETTYRDQNLQIDRLRDLRQLATRVPVPEELRLVPIEVRDPTVADECARVVATLVNQWPTLAVTPGKEGIESLKANATEREAFTEEVLRIASYREPGPGTLQRVADGVVSDGGGCSKLTFGSDLWDERYSIPLADWEDEAAIAGEKPEGKAPKRKDDTRGGLSGKTYLDAIESKKKGAGPPFRWTAVDIRNVYPVFQGATIGEVLEISERPVSSTFRRYRLRFDDQNNIVPQELGERQPVIEASQAGAGDLGLSAPPSVCQFIEHWDDVWCSHLVLGVNASGARSGVIVDQWKHGYGRHPYFFAPGMFMGWWRNRKIGWGISETKRWLVEYRAYLWTIHANMAARDLLPPVSVELPEGASPIRGDDGQPRAPEKYQLGMQYFAQPGEKRTPWQFPNMAAGLREQIAIVTEAIEKLGTPRMNNDPGEIGASGFAINQVLSEAKLRFDPLSQSIERMMEELTRFMWHLIRVKVRETVWVYATGEKSGWRGMGPDDLQSDVRIEWKLDPTLPSAQIIESRYWVEQVTNGFASRDQAIEAQGRNPDQVRFGIALDRIRERPWYQLLQETMVAAKVGRGDLVQQAWEAEQLAKNGMPGPSPQPGQAEGRTQGGMGTAGVPDMGALAMAPNGAGAAPVPQGPGNGSVAGVGPGAVVPTQSAAAGMVQTLGR